MAAMPESPLITVDEYLSTSYDPDLEFVDGVLVERNVGDTQHSLVQGNIEFFLRQRFPHLKVLPQLRTGVAKARFRIPDICVVPSLPDGLYLDGVPYIVVEVVSETDRWVEVVQKLREYHEKGAANIWIVEPRTKVMWIFKHPYLAEVVGDTIATEDQQVWLTRDEVFAS